MGRLDNSQLAQLNDMAYKGLQKKGLQKKVDERALKNQKFFKNLDKQVSEVSQKFNYAELREKNKDICEQIGQCPLSVLDMFEAMSEGTCMCLGLDIERSEACIADPSMLKIKKIIPTFMTADAFIDSSIFSLKKDENAHGGFTAHGKTQQDDASLAMGVGRESITGVMPLFLTREHWEIARRRSPPIYGLMCTLDVMGFATSQLLCIPFKVLIKALEDVAAEPTENNKKVLTLVLETCQNIVGGQNEFRKNLIT